MFNLVTGAGGFLGLYITELLCAGGKKVRAFCRGKYAELDALGVETVRGDILDSEKLAEACRGVHTIFHVAAVCGAGEPWKKYYRTNTLGTRMLLEAAKKAGVRKFVYTSSSSVSCDGSVQRGVNEEKMPRRWPAHYPHSKALAEESVLAANDPHGMLTCSLRPHLIWGRRDNSLIPRLIERARTGLLRRIGDGKNLVDMICVENVAEAHLQAAEALTPDSPVAGRAYFLSHGTPVNCWQWIDELLAIYDLPPVRKQISFRMAWNLGWAFEMLWKLFRWEADPPMTRFLATQMGEDHYYDIRRAREDFGFSPTVTKDEGMARLRVEFLRKSEHEA